MYVDMWTDQHVLPGNFKIWCYKLTFYQHLMYPLENEHKDNNYIQNGWAFPMVFLMWQLKSISLGYRKEKRLAFERLR